MINISDSPSVYVNDQNLEAMGFHVETPAGLWDGLAVNAAGTTIPGRAGQLAPVTDPGSAARTIVLSGPLHGSSNADVVQKLHALKALLGGGLLELRRIDDPTIMHVGRLLSIAPVPFGAALAATDYVLTVTIQCDDPYAYDVASRIVAFAQGATPIPLGTAPSSGLIRILPDPATGTAVNPVLTYRDITGTVRETMGFTRTLAAADYLDVDLSLFKVTRSVAGAPTNDIAAQTSGGFFALSPLDGGSAVWPTLEVSAGRAALLYRRAWQ